VRLKGWKSGIQPINKSSLVTRLVAVLRFFAGCYIRDEPLFT